MAGPWNADLSAALKFSDFTPTTTTTPTTAESTAIWQGESANIEGQLLSVGVTISASGKDKTAIVLVEAMLASAAVQEAAEKKSRGTVSPDTFELRRRGEEILARYISKPGILGGLGASVSRKRCESMTTKYPNSSKDTSTYKAPLMKEAGYGVDEDL